MHSVSEVSAGVPAFLAKLWKLVEDPETNDLICWSSNGKSFFIRNQARFARELLPHYYKHNNMASFVRQLNMYGFHKKVSVELGGLKCDKDEMEFAHQFFSKGHPFLMEHIKRKIASSKTQDPVQSSLKPELMSKVLAEVRNMRGRQEHLDSKLGAMKQENETLWRELAMLRQKHIKQQQIVNKLIQFLVTLVQPSSRGGGLSVKRRYPLMIDDSNPAKKKLAKSQASPTGPVIHELDASELDMNSEYIVSEMLENKSPAVHSPQEHIEALVDHENMENVNLVDSVQLEDDIQLINPYEINIIENHVEKCDDKSKKKDLNITRRKNKVPIKILIPPLKNGEKPREEMHLFEIPADEEPMTIALPKNKSVNSKPVPVATMRSSKLAAMAANMTEFDDMEHDDDDETPADMEEEYIESPYNNASIKLEDILIAPETYDSIQNHIENREDRNGKSNKVNKELNQIDGSKSVLVASSSKQFSENGTSTSLQEEKDNNEASTSASKDLALSCINSSDISETNYREEVDNHLETVGNGLNALKDFLRSESCTIEPSILQGLFNEDPFGFSTDSELNPDYERNDDRSTNPDSFNGSTGGEVMMYNPLPSLEEFNDILSTTSSSSLNNLYASDPLDLEDSKTSFLE